MDLRLWTPGVKVTLRWSVKGTHMRIVIDARALGARFPGIGVGLLDYSWPSINRA